MMHWKTVGIESSLHCEALQLDHHHQNILDPLKHGPLKRNIIYQMFGQTFHFNHVNLQFIAKHQPTVYSWFLNSC